MTAPAAATPPAARTPEQRIALIAAAAQVHAIPIIGWVVADVLAVTTVLALAPKAGPVDSTVPKGI